MVWYKIITLVALAIGGLVSAFHILRLVKYGKPTDYSKQAGNTAQAIRYSFTGAMSPKHKESAFLHLPTYSAGVIYHLGTFASIGIIIVKEASLTVPSLLLGFLVTAFFVSSGCGMGILIKRIVSAKMRNLSSPDDYISNLLVTLFHVLTAMVLVWPATEQTYYLALALLLLYFPIGKLKHAFYFFAARYHLGFFYGWRGTWPQK
jgi:hypothetical protein